MCEPWCWPPETVANLTDYQVIQIREGQNRRIAEQTKQATGNTAIAPPPAPEEDVRSGAAYEYLIGTGLSPEQAERIIRKA